jgi:methionyl-tRNA formyltransferase
VRIVFLAADDPLYLPAFFERVLAERGADVARVYVVPPLYKGQTSRAAAWRYFRTFGVRDTVRLARRVAAARLHRRSIASVCARWGVSTAVARDVNADRFLDELRSLEPDVVVSVSCPQIFRRPLIEAGAMGCLNIHGANLPEYRGVMPSFWMLANGEREAGISIYFVNEQIDAGEVCGRRSFEILPGETLDDFLIRSKDIAAELLLDVLGSLERGAVVREPLDLASGSYYSWPDRAAVKRLRASGHALW